MGTGGSYGSRVDILLVASRPFGAPALALQAVAPRMRPRNSTESWALPSHRAACPPFGCAPGTDSVGVSPWGVGLTGGACPPLSCPQLAPDSARTPAPVLRTVIPPGNIPVVHSNGILLALPFVTHEIGYPDTL